MKTQRLFKASNFLKLFQSIFPIMSIILLLTLVTMLLAGQSSQAYNSGLNFYNQGRFNEAREILEKAVVKGQAGIDGMALLGMTYIEMKEYKLARQILTDALQRDDKNKKVIMAFGKLEFAVGDFEAADKWLKDSNESVSFSEHKLESRVSFLINHSIELYQKSDFVQSKEALNEALSLDPYNLRTIAMLIQLCREQGYDCELIELYQRLLAVDTENAQAYAELGMLLDEKGRSSEAQKAFLNAEILCTDEPYPYFYLANSDREKRKHEKKEPSIAEISRLHLAIGKSVRKMSMIQLQAVNTIQKNQGELNTEELREFEKLSAFFIQPRLFLNESILMLKECYPDSNNYEQDIVMLIDWYPHSLELSCALGDLLEEQNRFEEAYEHWRGILEDFSTSAEAHIGLARCLNSLGKVPQADVAYRRARDLSPENSFIYSALNSIYISENKAEALLQWYSELYERERTNISLLNGWADLEETIGLLEEASIHRLTIIRLEQYD